MLKTKIIEHYKLLAEALELLNGISNVKLKTTNGYARVIKKKY